MHQNVHLLLENFIAYKLCLHKAVLFLKASGLGEWQSIITHQKRNIIAMGSHKTAKG